MGLTMGCWGVMLASSSARCSTLHSPDPVSAEERAEAQRIAPRAQSPPAPIANLPLPSASHPSTTGPGHSQLSGGAHLPPGPNVFVLLSSSEPTLWT